MAKTWLWTSFGIHHTPRWHLGSSGIPGLVDLSTVIELRFQTQCQGRVFSDIDCRTSFLNHWLLDPRRQLSEVSQSMPLSAAATLYDPAKENKNLKSLPELCDKRSWVSSWSTLGIIPIPIFIAPPQGLLAPPTPHPSLFWMLCQLIAITGGSGFPLALISGLSSWGYAGDSSRAKNWIISKITVVGAMVDQIVYNLS